MKIIKKLVQIYCISILISGCGPEPEPLTLDQTLSQVEKNLEALNSFQPRPTVPITLEEAIARAIKYNIQARVKDIESIVSKINENSSYIDALPNINTSINYSGRNNVRASSSRNLTTEKLFNDPSISEDKQQLNSNLELAWNILDLSSIFAKATQQGFESHLAIQARIKAINSITEDVRSAYYKAVAYELYDKEINAILKRCQSALNKAQQLERLRIDSPMKAIMQQKEIIDLTDQIYAIQRQVIAAKQELSNLMGLNPEVEFRVAIPSQLNFINPLKVIPPHILAHVSLMQRPEIKEEYYQGKINEYDAFRTIANIFPNLQTSLTGSGTTNSFALNKNWLEMGIRFAFNLTKLLKLPLELEADEYKKVLQQYKTLGTAVNVISQVYLTELQMRISEESFNFAKKSREYAEKLKKVSQARIQAGLDSEIDHAKYLLGVANAKLKEYLSFAELQGYFGKLLNSIGYEIVTTDFNQLTLPQLVTHIKARLSYVGDEIRILASKAHQKTHIAEAKFYPSQNKIYLKDKGIYIDGRVTQQNSVYDHSNPLATGKGLYLSENEDIVVSAAKDFENNVLGLKPHVTESEKNLKTIANYKNTESKTPYPYQEIEIIQTKTKDFLTNTPQNESVKVIEKKGIAK